MFIAILKVVIKHEVRVWGHINSSAGSAVRETPVETSVSRTAEQRFCSGCFSQFDVPLFLFTGEAETPEESRGTGRRAEGTDVHFRAESRLITNESRIGIKYQTEPLYGCDTQIETKAVSCVSSNTLSYSAIRRDLRSF